MSWNCYVALPGPRAGPIAPGALVKELYLVGLTADRNGLILAARKGGRSGGFRITLDEGLLDHLDELRADHGSPPSGARRGGPAQRKVRSALSPREIQARLRTGANVGDVAKEANGDVSWVERFAVPVLAEQNDAIDRATRLTVTTPRRGASDRPLVEAVALNLADRGVRLPESAADAGWSAYHRHGSQWNVRFTFRHRGREMRAEWRADLAEGTLVCENRLATDLGFSGPGGAHPVRPDVAEGIDERLTTRAATGPSRRPAPMARALSPAPASRAVKTTGRRATVKKATASSFRGSGRPGTTAGRPALADRPLTAAQKLAAKKQADRQ